MVEILFTAMYDIVFHPKGNPALRGHTSVFSFFIYGICSFLVERLYVYLSIEKGVPRIVRMPLYLLICYSWEFTTGLILRQFDACSWDYTHYKYDFMGLICLEYAPAWLFMCYWQDVIANFILSLSIHPTTHEHVKRCATAPTNDEGHSYSNGYSERQPTKYDDIQRGKKLS